MSIPAVILTRVSTAKQEAARQEHELKVVAEQNGWTVIEVVREQISGRASKECREGLSRVRELVRTGKVKKVLVHEVSRLSRRPSVVHDVVEEMENRGVSLYWHAQHVETLLPSGKRNPAAAMMMAVLAEMARAETDSLRERIKSGLAEALRKGKRLGRKPGKWTTQQFLARHQRTAEAIQNYPNMSIRELARLTNSSSGTIQRVQQALVTNGSASQ